MTCSPSSRVGSSSAASAVVASLMAAVVWLLVSAATAQAATTSYGYSSGYQYFTVPSGVTSVHFQVNGGSGSDGQGSYGGGSGASGANVTGDMSVSSGQTLTLWVGGAGQADGGAGYGSPSHDDFGGGSGGSGYGITTGNGGGGGAASDIRSGSKVLAVAGGGGGGGGGGTLGNPNGGAGSAGGYSAGGLRTNGWDAGAGPGANSPDAYGGSADHTYSDNGGGGASGGYQGNFGGGGGGGGGGYYSCDINEPNPANDYCFSAGTGGGGGGFNSGGGAGGAGGNSFADTTMSNVSFAGSGFSAGSAGQITLSYGTASTTSLNSSTSGTSYPGQSVRFNAFVSPSDGGGTVSFSSDGTAISGCTNLAFLAGGGTDWATSCTTSALPVGSHTITATYSGDGAYAGSSTTLTQTVNQNPTSTSLSAWRPSTGVNMTDYLTATVQSTDGGGTVTFSQSTGQLSGCGQMPLVPVHGAYQATCKQAWATPGSYAVTADYSGDTNYASSSATTSVNVYPAPSVSSVTPSAGPTSGNQTVTINGSNLTGVTKVTFGTAPATDVIVISDSQVTAKAPAHAAGLVNVTVTSPTGLSAVTKAGRYTYVAPPTVSAISPTTGKPGTVVTVTGTGFGGAKVAFGTTSATRVSRVSSTVLKATAPAGSGTVDVTVTTTGGPSATTAADQFTYTAS